MALLDAKCTNCGAALKVDGALDATNCEFCGAAFVVEKAVKNFYSDAQNYNEDTQFAQLPQEPTQASGAKSKAKPALFCGLASCAIPLLTGLIGITVVPSMPYYAQDGPMFFLAGLGMLSIILSIAGIVLGSISRKETDALSEGYASAGLNCAKVGLVLSCIATVIFFGAAS